MNDYDNERQLLKKIEKLNIKLSNKVDINLVNEAICVAKKAHADQLRQTGEPYYTHPIAVASLVADYLFSTDAIIVSLLHDTLEDTALTHGEISTQFSPAIADKVLDLTRVRGGVKISAADIVKLLWKEQKYDLLLIKLFDRLHNMDTLHGKSREKQIKTIQETLQYFLAVSEVLEVPHLPDLLYRLCYEKNLNLGVVSAGALEFDTSSDLFDLPSVENNSR